MAQGTYNAYGIPSNPSLLDMWPFNMMFADQARAQDQARRAAGAPKAVAPAAQMFQPQAQPQRAAPAKSKDPWADWFSNVIGTPVKITSGKRSPADNARVGGSKNSSHLTGEAFDLKVPGMHNDMVVQSLIGAGFEFDQIIDEGDHVHVGFGPKKRGQVLKGSNGRFAPWSPTVQGVTAQASGNPYVMPPLMSMTPEAAMGFVPDPRMLQGVVLPDAPQRAAPAPMPEMEEIDKQAMLAELTAAMQLAPQAPRDDKWERIQAMLLGGAANLGKVGPDAGLGQMILAAGTGAGAGYRQERDLQREEADARAEQERQIKIALAKAGFEIDMGNVDVRNKNKQIRWQSGESIKDVDFSNLTNKDQRKVQQILANNGITNQNIQALNETDARRGNVGLAALEAGINTQNQANLGQMELDRQAITDQGKTGVSAVLGSAGFTADMKASPQEKAAVAVQAKNAPAAMRALAEEMVTTGDYPDWLLDDKETQKLTQAIRKEDGGTALQIIMSALSKGDNALRASQELAGRGLPAATIISQGQ